MKKQSNNDSSHVTAGSSNIMKKIYNGIMEKIHDKEDINRDNSDVMMGGQQQEEENLHSSRLSSSNTDLARGKIHTHDLCQKEELIRKLQQKVGVLETEVQTLKKANCQFKEDIQTLNNKIAELFEKIEYLSSRCKQFSTLIDKNFTQLLVTDAQEEKIYKDILSSFARIQEEILNHFSSYAQDLDCSESIIKLLKFLAKDCTKEADELFTLLENKSNENESHENDWQQLLATIKNFDFKKAEEFSQKLENTSFADLWVIPEHGSNFDKRKMNSLQLPNDTQSYRVERVITVGIISKFIHHKLPVVLIEEKPCEIFENNAPGEM